MAAAADQVARVWMLDLRRKSFMEIGGTSRQQDIWACVRRRIETDPITECGVPVRLSPGQMMEVKRKARNLAANYVAADFDTVPFGDFVKVGLPLLLLTMVVTVVLAAVIYPLGDFNVG